MKIRKDDTVLVIAGKDRGRSGKVRQSFPKEHISNVVLLCPKCSRPGRIGSQSTKDGARARVCRRCGEVLD